MAKTAPTNRHEAKLRKAGHRLIAGVDEAGKGSWAGPLVTAAVILDETDIPNALFDSKMLTSQQREQAFVAIAKKALAWSVHIVPVAEIDLHGVHKANVAALKQAVEKLHISPDAVLVDAFKIEVPNTPVVHVIGGDALERTISAASILAKVTRDRLMSSEIHRAYPEFHFHVHKGYGTPLHAKLLAMHGPTRAHRMSFEPVKVAGVKKFMTWANKQKIKKGPTRTKAVKRSIKKQTPRARARSKKQVRRKRR